MGNKSSIANKLSIIAIIATIIGIIVPVINDNIINKRSITITAESEISLVTDNDLFDDLELYHKNNKINNLSKTIFILQNTGRVPFTNDDLVKDIKLVLSDEIDILKCVILRSSPKNVDVSFIINNNELAINFNLLNPKEYFEFCIYYTGKSTSYIDIESRIKNLNQIEFQDDRIKEIDENVKRNANWVTWLIGIWSLLCFLIVISDLKHIKNHRKIRKEILDIGFDNFLKSRDLDTIDKIYIFLNEEMGYLSLKKRNEFKKQIIGDAVDWNLFWKMIREELLTKGSTEASLGTFIFFIILGIVYFSWFLLF